MDPVSYLLRTHSVEDPGGPAEQGDWRLLGYARERWRAVRSSDTGHMILLLCRQLPSSCTSFLSKSAICNLICHAFGNRISKSEPNYQNGLPQRLCRWATKDVARLAAPATSGRSDVMLRSVAHRVPTVSWMGDFARFELLLNGAHTSSSFSSTPSISWTEEFGDSWPLSELPKPLLRLLTSSMDSGRKRRDVTQSPHTNTPISIPAVTPEARVPQSTIVAGESIHPTAEDTSGTDHGPMDAVELPIHHSEDGSYPNFRHLEDRICGHPKIRLASSFN
jgi:hypothetical protein